MKERKRNEKSATLKKNTYDISSVKRVTRKFLKVSRCSCAKQRQRNVQKKKKCAARAKKVCCTCKVTFLLIRPIVVFFTPFSLPSPLSITRFYILFGQTINIIVSFAFSPCEIYIIYQVRPHLFSAENEKQTLLFPGQANCGNDQTCSYKDGESGLGRDENEHLSVLLFHFSK